jgi:hypothetical protein
MRILRLCLTMWTTFLSTTATLCTSGKRVISARYSVSIKPPTSKDLNFVSRNVLVKQSFYSTLPVEQPTYLYNAIEFKNSISSLPGLLQKARNQEQEDEWLRVLQCTVYLIKIELKATEEIIAGVTDDAVINSRE